MKKILISVLVVLLLILTYVIFDKGINIGFIKIDSISAIKSESAKLDEDLNKANELSNKTYPAEVQGLEEAIRELKISKQEYENKKLYSNENEALGTVEIKTYTIHYLWTILGNYREDRDVKSLTLDLKSTENEDVYDLEFTLVGNYISITDFLYDIEEDEELNFEIKNFKISSEIITQGNTATEDDDEETEENRNSILSNNINTNKQNETTNVPTQKTDGTVLQATFTVENVGITLE